MSHHNGLPGFDAWLTTQPTGDEVEPSQHQLDQAYLSLLRDLLEDSRTPSEQEVYNLACMLTIEETQASQDEAEEHAAESSREDSEDRFGDGPP